MKKTDYVFKTIKLILFLIIILYFTFLYIDLFNSQYLQVSNNIKFASIILCFSISLLSKNNAFDPYNIKLLQLGLFLTIIADFFLLIVNDYYEIGIAIFSVVQITYSIRYDIRYKRNTIKKYFVILAILFSTYVVVNSFVKIALLVPISLFYGICLMTNVYKSIIIYTHKIYPKPNGSMVAIGMFFFLLCDINVALYNIIRTTYFQFNTLLHQISFVSMWLFYLPSQILLSLSGYKFK